MTVPGHPEWDYTSTSSSLDVVPDLYATSGTGSQGYSDAFDLAAVDVEGTGFNGAVGAAGTFDVAAEVSGTVAHGVIGTASVDVALEVSGSGEVGRVGSGSFDIAAEVAGTGSSGNIGSGSIGVEVEFTANPGAVGYAGTAGAFVVAVAIQGTGYQENTGTAGSFQVAVGIASLDAETGATSVITFSMNLATKAVTYQTTQFNSYAVVGGNRYGADANGIHLLGADTDAGAPIAAEFAKVGMSFGTSFVKCMTDMYLHMASMGAMQVAVNSGTASNTLSFGNAFLSIHGEKVNLPRGLKGRDLGFLARNVGGAFFEILAIEILLGEATRRGQRHHG